MPESLTPITREETYLAAIAGEEVSTPDPICRKEEFLDAIDTHIGSVEGDVSNVSGAVTALQTQIPASTAGDEGKVLTAGSTAGTASWQTPSGGGGIPLVDFTTYPARTVTVDSEAFDSSVNDLNITVDGETMVLKAGLYAFVDDLDTAPELPYVVKVHGSGYIACELPQFGYTVETEFNYSVGFNLRDNVDIKLVLSEDDNGYTFIGAFLPTESELAYSPGT